MKSWDELTRAEQDWAEYSDFYKSVHGIRPRWLGLEDFQDEANVKEMFENLSREAEGVFEAEAEREKQAIAKFEASVTHVIENGARDRETAIRWILDANDFNGDLDYFCYQMDLPYGYFQKVA